MQRQYFAVVLSGFVLALAGCNKSDSGDSVVSSSVTPGPDKAVATFLEAIKAGDEEKATQMLTPVARKKTAEMDLCLPSSSDTASFKVGEVELVADDGAHVASEWSDVDAEGQRHSDTVIWMLRKESEGWRVAGMATKVIEGEPPLILNFEDPEGMVRKQKMVEEELARRAAGEDNAQARRADANEGADSK